MKTIQFATIFSLILSLFTATANAGTKQEIARKATVLGNIAFGLNKHAVSARNAEEMVIQLAMKSHDGQSREAVLENFHRNLPVDEISFGDMIGWGTMGLESAIELYTGHDPKGDIREPDVKKQYAKNLRIGKQILRELHRMGMKFGFTDGSSSYCGMSFMGLLIVDEENETIYEIPLTGNESC